MNEIEKKLEKIAEQNRIRQARFYDKHKLEILAKKQTERDQLKILNTPPPPAPVIATEFTLSMILDIFKATISNENTLNKSRVSFNWTRKVYWVFNRIYFN
jgi:hypothetical protein